MEQQQAILLIDDDRQLAPPLREYFARFDLDLTAVAHPRQGLEMLAGGSFDLVILDVMLPEMDGFEVCREIRRQSNIPILMLTARGEVTDRVVGLELGADDYLPKPFEPRELVARIQNILKRARPETQNLGFKFHELVIDTARQKVLIEDREVEMTAMEYQCLVLLARAPGKVFSRDEILNRLKGVDSELFTRSVDILVSRLRKRLLPLRVIKTVRGAGYTLAVLEK